MEDSRNLGIDILCCFGVMLLLGIQYIEVSGYFNEPILSWTAAPAVAARWFCLSGAMVLSAGTGYALSGKKFSMGYFKIFIRLIYVYLVCTLAALGLRVLLLGESFTLVETIQAFVEFTATDTGRFAGMYFALLLAAPFLNAAFHGLPTRQARMSFLIVATAFSTLQPMLWIPDVYLLPEWCKGLFPAAAYIGGAYMKRYSKQKHVPLMILILILTCAAQTAAVMYASLSIETLWCPWLDSMASLPCLIVALCLLGILYSKKKGKGSIHRFFAGAAGGALAALILGDPLVDIIMPAVLDQFPDPVIRFWAGAGVVPIVFVLSCVLGLLLQMPLLGIRSRLHSEEAEEETDDDEMPPRTRKKTKSTSDVVVPERTHTRPRRAIAENDPRHTIRVAVYEPEAEVNLTQPAEEAPPGTKPLELRAQFKREKPAPSPSPPAPEPERLPQQESPTMEIPAQKPSAPPPRRRPMTAEEILGIPPKKEQKSTTESINDLIHKLSE